MAHELYDRTSILHYLMGERRFVEAWALVTELLDERPGDQELIFMRASINTNLNRMELAVADYKHLTELVPQHQAAWNNRGLAEQQLGRYAEAIESFTAAIAANPPNCRIPRTKPVETSRAQTYAGAGQLDLAFADSHLAYQLSSTSSVGRSSAVLFARYEDMPSYRFICKDMFKRLVAKINDYDLVNVVWTCALAPEAVRDLGSLIDIAETLVDKSLDDTNGAAYYGALLFHASHYDEALRTLTKSLEGNEVTFFDLISWYLLAMTHHRLGHVSHSIKWLEKANTKADAVLVDSNIVDWMDRMQIEIFRQEANSLIRPSE